MRKNNVYYMVTRQLKNGRRLATAYVSGPLAALEVEKYPWAEITLLVKDEKTGKFRPAQQ